MSRTRSIPFLLSGLALVAAGPVLLLALVGSRFARGAPLAFVALSFLGAGLVFLHARARRSILAFAAAALAAAFAALFLVGAVVATRVPVTAGVPGPGDAAPPFSLEDASGRAVSLADLLASGPRVLVFFRGTW